MFSPPGWSENWAIIATGIAIRTLPNARQGPPPLRDQADPPAPCTFAARASTPCGKRCGSLRSRVSDTVGGLKLTTIKHASAGRSTQKRFGCWAMFGFGSSSPSVGTVGRTTRRYSKRLGSVTELRGSVLRDAKFPRVRRQDRIGETGLRAATPVVIVSPCPRPKRSRARSGPRAEPLRAAGAGTMSFPNRPAWVRSMAGAHGRRHRLRWDLDIGSLVQQGFAGGGDGGIRTRDPLRAKQVLSH